MHTLNAANILVMLVAAGVSLYAAYRIIKWIGCWVLDGLDEVESND